MSQSLMFLQSSFGENRLVCGCRKLMGHKPTLQDLQDVHPTIHASLQKLLAQDNAAQLGLVFQVLSQTHCWLCTCS